MKSFQKINTMTLTLFYWISPYFGPWYWRVCRNPEKARMIHGQFVFGWVKLWYLCVFLWYICKAGFFFFFGLSFFLCCWTYWPINPLFHELLQLRKRWNALPWQWFVLFLYLFLVYVNTKCYVRSLKQSFFEAKVGWQLH